MVGYPAGVVVGAFAGAVVNAVAGAKSLIFGGVKHRYDGDQTPWWDEATMRYRVLPALQMLGQEEIKTNQISEKVDNHRKKKH